MVGEANYLPEARRLMQDHPRWEAWVGIVNRQWHARLKGAVPPVMAHDDNPQGLRQQIEQFERQQ